MAQPILCDFGCGLEADFLIGNTKTGEQIAACAGDAARWGLELAKVLLPPEEIASQLQARLSPVEAGNADGGKPKRSRKSAAPAEEEPLPESLTPEVVPEDAAAAPDG